MSDSEVTLRLARASDIDALIALNKLCFASMAEENVVWKRAHLLNHMRVFPEGQIVAELDGELVGAVASLIVHLGVDPYRTHTYSGITDGGYFHNHDAQGDTLYGADVYVHPDHRRKGIAQRLYQARRDLCRKLNLRRILAGGRIPGFVDHVDMGLEAYVRAVDHGELTDPVLTFQLQQGFVVRGVLRNYIADPLSRNCATLIEWLNPDYRPPLSETDRKVRVAAVQYHVRKVRNLEDFGEQVRYFVEAAATYRADFVVFPEFFSVALLSQDELKDLDALAGIRRLAQMEEPFLELMSSLAQTNGVYIIGGSHPLWRDGVLYNMCPIFFPDGSYVLQPKLHITPSEKRDWGITGGHELLVIPTPKAKIGVLVCYDSEFPEAARYLTDQGAEILFVPYCTDDRQGHMRVRLCSQARAIENQVYVVTAGVIGNLPSVPSMDIHYGRAAVFTPSDFEFARDGIAAQADSNVEMLLITDLDIHDLYRSRAAGSVTPRLDRRTDLFEFRARLRNAPLFEHPEETAPLEVAPQED